MSRLFIHRRVSPTRLWTTRAAAALATAYLGTLLSGCGSHEPPQTLLAPRCTPINGTRPLDLRVTPPLAGPMRIVVEQRGVSVVGTVRNAAAGPHRWRLSASSPIERYGVMTFVRDVHAGEPVRITVRSHDSPEITGEVCVAVDRLPPGNKRLLRAESAFASAGQAVQAKNWSRAFDLYLAAAREVRGIDEQRLAQARHAMAEIAYANLRDDDGAYVLASWALADFGPNANAGLRSTLVTLQARAMLESQRFDTEVRRARVDELLRRSEALARASKLGARELPRFDILRGFMEFRTGHAAEASERFMRAAEQCKALRDWECYARARQNVAVIAEDARDYPAVLQAYQDALNVLPPELNPTLLADIWGNYGRVQSMAGLFRQAEQSHRTSMRLHAELADCDGTRMALARLGTLLVQVGSVGEGRSYLGRAASLECGALIAAAKRESDPDSIGPEDIAASPRRRLVCDKLRDPSELTDAGKIALFNALLGLHDALQLENDSIESERCLASAWRYAGTARTQLRLANAEGASLIERGDPARADAAFQRGLATADRAQLSPAHENRSLAYLGLARARLLERKPARARDFAARALTLGASRGDVRQLADALQLMARSFEAEGATERAASILHVAVDLIEQVPIDELDAEQRATWLATQHGVFAELTTLLATQAGADEARVWQTFEVSERGRARSLRYAMSQATDTRATSSSEPASARYRELMRRISERARASQQSANAAPLSVESVAEVIEQQALPPDRVDDTLQRRLAALDATVVEYAAGEDSMFAFVIDGQHIHLVRLGSRREIGAAASALYERVRNPESASSDVRDAARRVAELALWPVAQLVTQRRVIFVPDDALHMVPFAVLPWTADAAAPLVVERVESSIMPSTLFITRADTSHAKFAGAPRLELIGDPVFRAADWQRECRDSRGIGAFGEVDAERVVMRSMHGSLPRLPGSREEVAAIAELAHRYSPGSRVEEHLGCAATPRALREAAATGPTLLHIATHGYVDAYRPRLSALALTPDEDSKGVTATFGLLDILQMKIDTRLVVLSACDTSRGRLLPGEGVLGPAQAFLQAGAASVLASSWRIADHATAPFMRTFYHYLLVERMTAAAALRQTQLDYARAGRSHEWAAFTLFGWPDTFL
ncbi:MAG TPA: CHAT domain-containing protein [Steroidobacteraceae bacterium]|nr:CHAT domain-containing protein [Steroidobacteraceae bacterium]